MEGNMKLSYLLLITLSITSLNLWAQERSDLDPYNPSRIETDNEDHIDLYRPIRLTLPSGRTAASERILRRRYSLEENSLHDSNMLNLENVGGMNTYAILGGQQIMVRDNDKSQLRPITANSSEATQLVEFLNENDTVSRLRANLAKTVANHPMIQMGQQQVQIGLAIERPLDLSVGNVRDQLDLLSENELANGLSFRNIQIVVNGKPYFLEITTEMAPDANGKTIIIAHADVYDNSNPRIKLYTEEVKGKPGDLLEDYSFEQLIGQAMGRLATRKSIGKAGEKAFGETLGLANDEGRNIQKRRTSKTEKNETAVSSF